MYIEKYWGEYIGGSDDSLTLVAFLEDQKKEEIALSEIFAKIGLDRQNWNFRQTVKNLGFTHSIGVETDFHFAIDVIIDIAATPEEYNTLDKALVDFIQNLLEYDLSEFLSEDDVKNMTHQVEALRKELYEISRTTITTII